MLMAPQYPWEKGTDLFLSVFQFDERKARTILEDLCAWDVVVNDAQSVLSAIDLKAKHQLSFWDSLILEAARRSGATTVYSEYLSHEQRVGGVTIVNPFET